MLWLFSESFISGWSVPYELILALSPTLLFCGLFFINAWAPDVCHDCPQQACNQRGWGRIGQLATPLKQRASPTPVHEIRDPFLNWHPFKQLKMRESVLHGNRVITYLCASLSGVERLTGDCWRALIAFSSTAAPQTLLTGVWWWTSVAECGQYWGNPNEFHQAGEEEGRR